MRDIFNWDIFHLNQSYLLISLAINPSLNIGTEKAE